MPLPVAHGLLGASIVAALLPESTQHRYSLLLFAGAILANAADLDFLLVFALNAKSWHRGFTHSVVFGLFAIILASLLLGRGRIKVVIVGGLAFTSHCLLDFLTSKEGSGVELLWPFSDERIRLGWLGLSETPSKLSEWGIVKALGLEFAIFTPLFLAVVMLRMAGRPKVIR